VPDQRPEDIFRLFSSFLHQQFENLHSGDSLIGGGGGGGGGGGVIEYPKV